MFARMMLLLGLCLALTAVPKAQQHRSIVRGITIGAAGEPVANVPMRAMHEGTGEARRFVSDANGTFTIVQLEPGSYRFVSDDDRFRSFLARVLVKADDDIVITLPLTSGSISQDVDFRSFVLLVETDSPALRTRLPGDFITSLPLDGRSLFDALLLTPRFGGHPAGPRADGVLTPNYWLDGFLNTSAVEGAPVVNPQIESVAAFESAVPLFDASFGGAGPAINVLTRSGTNQFTGGAFGFLQTKLDRQQAGGFAGGALSPDRTFIFGDLQHTRFSDELPQRDSGTDAGVRVDHAFGESAWLTARYAISDGIFFGRRGQLFGTALRHGVSHGVNDVRFTVSDRDGDSIAAAPAPRMYSIADTFAWAAGSHALRAGGAFQQTEVRFVSDGKAETYSVFVQDDWRPAAALSVEGGIRVDWLNPPESIAEAQTHVSPRLGFAWNALPESGTIVRGGYGRFAEPSAMFANVPAIDQWTIGIARQWSRTRTIEVAYEGARFPDVGRFNALVVEIEQRSEVGLTGHLAYVLGRTDPENALPGESDDDARHKLTGAFTWRLPFGHERLLFSDGLMRDIFGEMQLTGVFVMEGARTDPQTGSRGNFRTLDLGLMKDVRIADRILQLRFETFNTLNRSNRRPFFYPDLLNVPFPGQEGRRYQIGARFLF